MTRCCNLYAALGARYAFRYDKRPEEREIGSLAKVESDEASKRCNCCPPWLCRDCGEGGTTGTTTPLRRKQQVANCARRRDEKLHHGTWVHRRRLQDVKRDRISPKS